MNVLGSLFAVLAFGVVESLAGQNYQQVRITPAINGPADVLVLPLEANPSSGKTQFVHTARKGYAAASQWQFRVTPTGENSWRVELRYFRLADSNNETEASSTSCGFTVDGGIQRVNCGWAIVEIERFVH